MNPSLARVAAHAIGLLGLILALVACRAPLEIGSGSVSRASAVIENDVQLPAGPLVATSFLDAQRNGEAMLVFVYVPATGFAYRDERDRPTGATIELLRDFAHYVAEAHDIDLQVHWMEEPSWSTFYGQVRAAQGGVLGVGNVTITNEREAELDFSPPYMNNIAALVTHRSVPELPSMARIGDRFSSLTGLVFPGTLHESRLKSIRQAHFPAMVTRPVESNDELVALLAADEGYFGYVDIYNFWRAEQAGLPLRRHPAGDDASEAFGVILPDGSDWTPVIAEFLRAEGGYVQGPRFRAHMARHLGAGLAELLLEQ